MTTKAFAMALALGLSIGSAQAATVADLYGDWSGIWSVTERYDDVGPLNLPDFVAPVVFHIHAFDSATGNYGSVDVLTDDVVPGIKITGLSVSGQAVSIELTYPTVTLAFPMAIVMGLLDDIGVRIDGTYVESVIARQNWNSWSGPLQLNLVPEPSGLALASLGMMALGLTIRRRNIRAL